MGTIKSGIFGGVSGKVGNLTGSSWKGIPIVKSRPQSVAYPATTGQVAQTTKMSAIVSFSKQILSSWIKPLWDRAAVQMSGYNAFVRANIAEFADGVINDYANLIMSQGTMGATEFLLAAPSGGDNTVVLTWNSASLTGLQLSSDIAFALIVNETSGLLAVASGSVRNVNTITVTFNETLVAGDVLHAYLCFKRANGTVISGNSYTTVTVIA